MEGGRLLPVPDRSVTNPRGGMSRQYVAIAGANASMPQKTAGASRRQVPAGAGAESRAGPTVRGLLLDVDRFATHDGPGIRTAVCLKGCSLPCLWCHSPESRSNRPDLPYQQERCTGCGLCLPECPEKALTEGEDGGHTFAVLDRDACDGRGACVEVCYRGALRMAGSPVIVGEVLASIESDVPFFRSTGGGVTLTGGEPAGSPSSPTTSFSPAGNAASTQHSKPQDTPAGSCLRPLPV